MIRGADVLAAARAAGFDMLAGVPCSYLTPLINAALADVGYLSATNEGEAVAIAAGAWLAGKRPLVMMQNSGLGNAVSPLTSLVAPCRMPLGLVVTWRGQPGTPDEPQHALMGEIMPRLLELVGARHEPLTLEAFAHARDGVHAFILTPDTIAHEPMRAIATTPREPGRIIDHRDHGALPARVAMLEQLAAFADPQLGAALISTTGKCSRELFTIADRPSQFYLVGAMGCASAVALGVARHVARRVICVDGDGALLMRLETLATIGALAPPNLVHVVLDNGSHDSTGGQPTAAPHTDFAALAVAAGYPLAYRVDSPNGLARVLRNVMRDETGLCLVHARIAPGSMAKLGRPTLSPAEVAARFRDYLKI